MEGGVFFLISIVIILFTITIHEFSHALVATWLGDVTPRAYGRLTLNPLKHLDPIGFLMLLIVRFGWARPVPINPSAFADPKRDSALVSLAGPLSNFLAAWIFGTFLRFNLIHGYWPLTIFQYTVWINLALGIFNLLPVPPLDGSHLLPVFLSEEMAWRYRQIEPYGFFILIIILLFPGTQLILINLINALFRLIT